MKTGKALKAVKAGTLAISAEKIGSEDEAVQAARTCGQLTLRAGHTLDDVYAELTEAGIKCAYLTWNCIVDGYFDAAA